MKGLFENDDTNLIIGREGEKLTVELTDSVIKLKIKIKSDQLIDLEQFVHKMILEIENEQWKKIPFWKRLF